MIETENWFSIKDLKNKIDAGIGFEENTWVPTIVDWIYNTIAEPNVQMNRKGAVCPFVPYALDINLIYLTFPKKRLLNNNELVEYLHKQLQIFLDTEPYQPNKDAIYKSLLVAFPYFREDQEELVKKVSIEIKPNFLRFGVTCGEFYSSNNDRSVRNSDVLVAKSPVPLIAIRYLTPHDELFLQTQPELYKIFSQWKEGCLSEE